MLPLNEYYTMGYMGISTDEIGVRQGALASFRALYAHADQTSDERPSPNVPRHALQRPTYGPILLLLLICRFTVATLASCFATAVVPLLVPWLISSILLTTLALMTPRHRKALMIIPLHLPPAAYSDAANYVTADFESAGEHADIIISRRITPA